MVFVFFGDGQFYKMYYKKKSKKESPATEQLRILRAEERDKAHKSEKKKAKK